MPEPKRRSSLRAALKKKRAREVWIAVIFGIIMSGVLAGLLLLASHLKQP